MNTEQYISKARTIHGDKYDYSKVTYVRAVDKVEIVCPIHGPFFQKACNHTNAKQGCPHCCRKNRAHTNETFDILLAESGRNVERMGDYVDSHTHIDVRCGQCDHVWAAMPTKLIGSKATGCPRCRTEHGVFGTYVEKFGVKFRSMLECDCYEIIIEFCNQRGFSFEHQKKYPQSVTNHTCDFFIPELKLWIETSNISTNTYMTRLQQKIKWVYELQDNFLLAKGPKHLKEILYGEV